MEEQFVKLKCSDNIGFPCFHMRGHPYSKNHRCYNSVIMGCRWDCVYYCVHCNQVRMLSIFNLSSSGESVLTSVVWLFEFIKNHHQLLCFKYFRIWEMPVLVNSNNLQESMAFMKEPIVILIFFSTILRTVVLYQIPVTSNIGTDIWGILFGILLTWMTISKTISKITTSFSSLIISLFFK